MAYLKLHNRVILLRLTFSQQVAFFITSTIALVSPFSVNREFTAFLDKHDRLKECSLRKQYASGFKQATLPFLS